MQTGKIASVLTICVAAAALSGCQTMAPGAGQGAAIMLGAAAMANPMVPYNQSQDDLRASAEKFGGREFLHMPMEQFLRNVFLTTRHCKTYPEYVVSPDNRSMTASLRMMGFTEYAYQMVIDADEKDGGVEISYWGQNERQREQAAAWIEQMKNPTICRKKGK